jgi:hypothetical protein
MQVGYLFMMCLFIYYLFKIPPYIFKFDKKFKNPSFLEKVLLYQFMALDNKEV